MKTMGSICLSSEILNLRSFRVHFSLSSERTGRNFIPVLSKRSVKLFWNVLTTNYTRHSLSHLKLDESIHTWSHEIRAKTKLELAGD